MKRILAILIITVVFSSFGMKRKGLKRSLSWNSGMNKMAEMKTELNSETEKKEAQEERLSMWPTKKEALACCLGVLGPLECCVLTGAGCLLASIVGLDYLAHGGYLDDEGS